jgi:acetyl esterase/lipase
MLASLSLMSTPFIPSEIIPLWPSGNPGGWTRADKEVIEKAPDADYRLVKNVSFPTLDLFLAPEPKPNTPLVMICPGGGYWVNAIEHEGWEVAKWLNEEGIHAAVLKYRLPDREKDKPLHKVAWEDACRAMRILRSLAEKKGFSKDRIGIMGFSAGGHLAAVTSTSTEEAYKPADDIDKESVKPNFTVLIYPAYLEVKDKPLQLVPEVKVTKETPPAFLVHTQDDEQPVGNSLTYSDACRVAKVPAEMHIYGKGGHGYGLRSEEPGLRNWPLHLLAWIKRLNP